MVVDSDIIDVAEAAKLLKLHRNTILKLCKENKIPHVRLANRCRFSRMGLEEFVRSSIDKMEK